MPQRQSIAFLDIHSKLLIMRATLLCLLISFTIQLAVAAAPLPAPQYAAERPSLSDEDLSAKTEGNYWTGLPLVSADPDTGIGYGARVYHFENGASTEETFGYEPYRSRTFLQAFATSKGWQYHQISFDAPFFEHRPQRIKADFIFEQNTAANFFVAGTSTLEDAVNSGFNKYWIRRPIFSSSYEQLFFGSRLRIVGTALVSQVKIETTPSSQVALLCAQNALHGCSGGMNSTYKISASYDVRDFEPDPNSGFTLEGVAQGSSQSLGSELTYGRATLQARGFYSPLPSKADLVLAGRLLWATQSGNTPFYDQSVIALADEDMNGLGGRRTLRGFKQNRFIGRTITLGNLEARYTIPHQVSLGSHRFALQLVPFVDFGKTIELSEMEKTTGAAVRIAWNQATLIAIDYGQSREGSGLYINFGHAF